MRRGAPQPGRVCSARAACAVGAAGVAQVEGRLQASGRGRATPPRRRPVARGAQGRRRAPSRPLPLLLICTETRTRPCAAPQAGDAGPRQFSGRWTPVRGANPPARGAKPVERHNGGRVRRGRAPPGPGARPLAPDPASRARAGRPRRPQAVEIVPGRYFMTILKRPDALARSPIAAASICYCIDHDLVRAAAPRRRRAASPRRRRATTSSPFLPAATRAPLLLPLAPAAWPPLGCAPRPRLWPPPTAPRRRRPMPPPGPRPLAPLQVYEPFYADFGPLNLGRTYRFCEITARLLKVRAAGAGARAQHGMATLAGRRALTCHPSA
jgi:hypothetical protein